MGIHAREPTWSCRERDDGMMSGSELAELAYIEAFCDATTPRNNHRIPIALSKSSISLSCEGHRCSQAPSRGGVRVIDVGFATAWCERT
jgi:hypothetical protein